MLSFFPSDVGTPVVKTYAKNGNKIDSIWLFDERPAATVGLISKQFATITKNKLIQFTDSSSYTDSLDNLISAEVIKKIFYFDEHGQINQKQ